MPFSTPAHKHTDPAKLPSQREIVNFELDVAVGRAQARRQAMTRVVATPTAKAVAADPLIDVCEYYGIDADRLGR